MFTPKNFVINLYEMIKDHVKNIMITSVNPSEFLNSTLDNILLQYHKKYFIVKAVIKYKKDNNTIANTEIHNTKELFSENLSEMLVTKNVKFEYSFSMFIINKTYKISVFFKRIPDKKLFKVTSIYSDQLKDQEDRIIQLLNNAGPQGLTRTQLNSKTRTLTKHERDKIINHLLDENLMRIHTTQAYKKIKKIYIWNEEL